MKRLFFLIALTCASMFSAKAQDVKVPEGYVAVDSIVYRPADAVDATMQGKSIFTVINGMGDNVSLTQDAGIVSGMKSHIANNSKKKNNGYRVRIFFDNKQNSRGASEAALGRFKSMYPGIPAYRSFTSPFFKVTVGDFRTKSEATQLLQSLKPSFPSAFIVKEQINYPAVDKSQSFVIDTVKVFRSANESAAKK